MSVTPSLTTEQVMLLCDCFQRMDSAGDSAIDQNELHQFLKGSFPDADDDTLALVRKVLVVEGDSNEDGRIDIREFIDLVSRRQYEAVLEALNSEPTAARDPPQQREEVEPDTDARIQSILANLEPQEIDVLRDAFIKLDTDGDGFLSRPELRRGVEIRLRERFAASWPYLEKIFEVADRDLDDRLSIFEFLSSFADGPGVVPHEVVADCVEGIKIRLTDAEVEALRDRFCEIDLKKDNFIDKDELFVAMKELLSSKYPSMSDSEFEDIVATVIATADADKDGKLNLSEFIRSYQEDQGVLPGTFLGRGTEDVKRRFSPEEVQRLKAAFASLDAEKPDGFNDYKELYSAVSQVLRSIDLSESDIGDLVDYIMLTAQRNADGKLSLSDFARDFANNTEDEAINSPLFSSTSERRAASVERLAEIGSASDLERMLKLFKYMDDDKTRGFMERDDMFKLLYGTFDHWYPEWNDEQKQRAVEAVFAGADTDAEGRLSIDALVRYYISGLGVLPIAVVRQLSDLLHEYLSVEELRTARDRMSSIVADNAGNPLVDNEGIQAAFAAALGPLLTDKQLAEVVGIVQSKVDTDASGGKVALSEFLYVFALSSTEEDADRVAPPGEPDAPVVAAEAPVTPHDSASQLPTHATVSSQTPTKGFSPLTSLTLGNVGDARSPITNDVSGAAITDAQLREAFRRFDTSGTGLIPKADFKKQFLSLEWCGLTPSDAEFEKLWTRYCSTDTDINYDEFCLFMLHRSRL